MPTAVIDAHEWRDDLEVASASAGACKQEKDDQINVTQRQRRGEMHCIEPMSSTFTELQRVGEKLDLQRKGLVFTHAAIASTYGVAKFPNASFGTEYLGIRDCDRTQGKYECVEVPVYSLD